MPLLVSSIVPHTPLLLPSIGKENWEKLSQTRIAYGKIEKKIIERKINTIILLSSGKTPDHNGFFVNTFPKMTYNLEDFGDSSRDTSWLLDTEISHIIKEKISPFTSLRSLAREQLGHHFSVPLLLLTAKMTNIKIIPIYTSDLDALSHFKFGELLGEEIKKSTKNIAVICSAHLSNKLDKKSPAGYSPRGKKADKKITEAIRERKIDELIAIDQEYLNEAGQYHFKSIILHQGIMGKINNSPRPISQESPFGINYSIIDFEI